MTEDTKVKHTNIKLKWKVITKVIKTPSSKKGFVLIDRDSN